MSLLGIREGTSPEVRNERRNLCCFQLVVEGDNGILNKGELGLDLVELVGNVLVVVIIVVVLLDLSDHVPVIEVRCGLVQGMISGSGAGKQVVEPAREQLSDLVRI